MVELYKNSFTELFKNLSKSKDSKEKMAEIKSLNEENESQINIFNQRIDGQSQTHISKHFDTAKTSIKIELKSKIKNITKSKICYDKI